LEKHPDLSQNYIPIELSFHIANLNSEDILYFNSLNISHQVKTDSNWRPVRFEMNESISLGDSLENDEIEPVTNPSETDQILEKLDRSEEEDISEVAVKNLGVFSVEDQNEDFLLTRSKIPIPESGVSFFKMVFFVEKELFFFFDYLEIDENADGETQQDASRIALRQGNDDFNGEKNVRLQVNIRVSAAGDDAEFGKTWYYYYK